MKSKRYFRQTLLFANLLLGLIIMGGGIVNAAASQAEIALVTNADIVVPGNPLDLSIRVRGEETATIYLLLTDVAGNRFFFLNNGTLTHLTQPVESNISLTTTWITYSYIITIPADIPEGTYNWQAFIVPEGETFDEQSNVQATASTDFYNFSQEQVQNFATPDDFTYATLAEISANITLTGTSDVKDAIIQIQPPTGANLPSGLDNPSAIYFRGKPSAAGVLQTKFTLPSALDSVDVIVTLPNYIGPYSDETLRTTSGIFAPAARVNVSLQELANLPINFIMQRQARIFLTPNAEGVVPIPSEALNTITLALPERSAANAAFLSDEFDPNLHFVKAGRVQILFVHEGAGFKNSLGYFTYSENNGSVTILERGMVFANASLNGSGGDLLVGQLHTIADTNGNPIIFPAGTKMGFFIVSNGWLGGDDVVGWDPLNPAIPSITASSATDYPAIFTSIPELNPETARNRLDINKHIAMMEMPAIDGFLDGQSYRVAGFEDLHRDVNSDEDFNDLIFIVQSDPFDAVDNSKTIKFDADDADGDGVKGFDDFFPNDPDRAFVIRTPTEGNYYLSFEDLYPEIGDADYNDVGLLWEMVEVTNANNELVDIIATFTFIARGAGWNHDFGFHLEGLSETAQGTVQIEHFLPNGDHALGTSNNLDDYRINGQARLTVIEDTRDVLPALSGLFTNTTSAQLESQPARFRVRINFAAPVNRDSMTTPPYDPYLLVEKSAAGVHDIHLPGKQGFADRNPNLPQETGATTFIDAAGNPWALNLPMPSWAYPLEKLDIDNTYPLFSNWRVTGGALSPDWYAYPDSGRTIDTNSLDISIEPDWTIALDNL